MPRYGGNWPVWGRWRAWRGRRTRWWRGWTVASDRGRPRVRCSGAVCLVGRAWAGTGRVAGAECSAVGAWSSMETGLERLGVVREEEDHGQGGAYLARDREDGTRGRTSDRCKWAKNEAVAQSTAGFTSRPVVRLLAGTGQGPGGDTGSGSAAAGRCLAAIEFNRVSQDPGLPCWMQCRWVSSGLGAG